MSRTALVLLVTLVLAGTVALVQHGTAQKLAGQLHRSEEQLASERTTSADLRERVSRVEQERDKVQRDASEIHRLRAEISSLRESNKALNTQAARAPAPSAPSAPEQHGFAPPAFATYGEMGKYIGALRAKALGAGTGPLTPEERQYLESLKPDLEKLEGSPPDFAAFQTELIQSAAGISDPEKTERIRHLIQRVYENAVSRKLDLPSRPTDDLTWVEERYQLDRRGTTAVAALLSEEERAAFGKNFVGIMGVDLGLGGNKAAGSRTDGK